MLIAGAFIRNLPEPIESTTTGGRAAMRIRLYARASAIVSIVLPSALILFCACASADTTLELKNDFIETFKNRATIDATYSIKFAHSKPKTPSPSKPSNDGDIHISGTGPEIGLLTVAEIMNAKDFPDVLKFVQDKQASGELVSVTGVWRIWPEHGGESHHVQGEADASEIVDTNPPHIFEVHPLIKVGSFDVSSSFKPIPGFRTKDAQSAFGNYEGARSKIVAGEATTRIRMSMATYNYVEFKLELLESPSHELEDGLTAFARIRTLDGETLVQKRRLVFVKGTKPETAIRKLKQGQCMHALGMPRLDLTLVSWRVRCSKNQVPDISGCSEKFPDVLDWGIPYEVVILGDYGGTRKCDQ